MPLNSHEDGFTVRVGGAIVLLAGGISCWQTSLVKAEEKPDMFKNLQMMKTCNHFSQEYHVFTWIIGYVVSTDSNKICPEYSGTKACQGLGLS